MEKLTQELLAKMLSALQKVSAQADNYLQLSKHSFEIAKEANKELKEFVSHHPFKDDAEEIHFFKSIKPAFLSEMIYYMELYHLEANKPVGSAEQLQQYYLLKQDQLTQFFANNREFYNYHRLEKTHLDAYFFLRRESDPDTPTLYDLEMDANFSTHYSHILAKIMAFEHLQVYLAQAMAGTLEGPLSAAESVSDIPSEIQWNSSEAWFGELILAVYYSGVVNFEGGLSKFAARMEAIFHKKVNNIYRLHVSLSMRKKDKTPLMHHFINTMERKYEEKDL